MALPKVPEGSPTRATCAAPGCEIEIPLSRRLSKRRKWQVHRDRRYSLSDIARERPSYVCSNNCRKAALINEALCRPDPLEGLLT
jgi:hypothetical protein